jgi:predicted nucleic acid-binding protein
VSRTSRTYTLDTDLFIEGLRNAAANKELVRFHTVFAPFEYLSAVVAQELRAGAVGARDRRLVGSIMDPFLRRGRVITPSFQAWQDSGDVLRTLTAAEGAEIGRMSKAFGNDVLLALSCREAGVTLVTGNRRDFARIRRVVSFEFVGPWPGPTG